MRKVLVLVAVFMGLGSSVTFAQEVAKTDEVVTTTQTAQDDFTKIEVKDLPAAITEALGKSYAGATIKEAAVATKDDAKQYKVVLTKEDGTEVTALMNEKGEEIK